VSPDRAAVYPASHPDAKRPTAVLQNINRTYVSIVREAAVWPGVIFHNDRGPTYTASCFQAGGPRAWLNRVDGCIGSCPDNATAIPGATGHFDMQLSGTGLP
jgi:hypothetical protein